MRSGRTSSTDDDIYLIHSKCNCENYAIERKIKGDGIEAGTESAANIRINSLCWQMPENNTNRQAIKIFATM